MVYSLFTLPSSRRQANTNEIVLASTHDVQEVDVTSLVAAQPYTWIGDDFDKESRSSDDADHRSSHTNIAQASSAPFAPPQMAVSASMPWLGSGQTSMGASVVGRLSLAIYSSSFLFFYTTSLENAHYEDAFTCSHLADTLLSRAIYSKYRDIPPKASRVKCLDQGHNVIFSQPGIEPATFRLLARFPNRSAT